MLHWIWWLLTLVLQGRLYRALHPKLYATRNLCMRDFLKLHHNWDAYMGVQKERKSTFLTALEHREKEKGWKSVCQDYSWNLGFFIHSDFVVITPESSNKFPWISIWRVVKPHANYCVDILNTRWLRLAFAELYGLLRVNQAKERVAVRVWNAPDKWRNWRGQGCEPPHGKLNVQTGPSTSWYFGIYYSFGFQ